MFTSKELEAIKDCLQQLRQDPSVEVWLDVELKSESSAKQLFKAFGFEVGRTVQHASFVTFKVRNFRDECPDWHIFSE